MAFFKDLNDTNPTEKPEVLDIDSIKQSILDIVFTNEGEVPFTPDYGLSLDNYLFDLDADIAEFDILSSISAKLVKFDNRASLDIQNSSATMNSDINKLDLTLSFTVNGVSDSGFTLSASL